jgi:hypothetical protein
MLRFLSFLKVLFTSHKNSVNENHEGKYASLDISFYDPGTAMAIFSISRPVSNQHEAGTAAVL